jgi:DNA-binding transcriptional MerR regulator
MCPGHKRRQELRIGELARLTGTTPKAIRLYETRGLMGLVTRQGSYRQYGDEDVARVQLIRKAQVLGFRLAQLDDLAQLHTPQGWSRMAALLEARRVAVAQEIAQLQAVSEQIESLTQKLHDCDVARAPAWPVCEGLSPAAGTR